MITLEELQKADLKKLIKTVLEKKDVLAQVVVAGISIVVLIAILGNPQGGQYRQEIQQLNAKISVIHDYEQGLKDQKLFLAALPKELDEDQFSAQIVDYASQSHVNILAFSPTGKKEEGLAKLSTVSTLQINIHVDKYKDFLMFLKNIEGSPFALRIDSCFLTGKEDKGIDAEMAIAYVSVKK